MSAEKNIHTALATRLQAIQSSGSPQIAYENQSFTPMANVLYLEEHFMPNLKDQVGIEDTSTDDYEGIYQVTVKAPADKLRFTGQEQARLVSAHFPRGAQYTAGGVTVRITRTQVNPGFIDADRYIVPVSIYWRVLS